MKNKYRTITTNLGIKIPLTTDDFRADMNRSNITWKICTILMLIITVILSPFLIASTFSAGGFVLIGFFVLLIVDFFIYKSIFYTLNRIKVNENGIWKIALKRCSGTSSLNDSDGGTDYYMHVDGNVVGISNNVFNQIDKGSPVLCLYQIRNRKNQFVKAYNNIEFLFDEYNYDEYVDISPKTPNSSKIFPLLSVLPVILSVLTIVLACFNIAKETAFYQHGNEIRSVIEFVETYKDSDGDDHKTAYTSFVVGDTSYDDIEVSNGSKYHKGDEISVYVNDTLKNRKGESYSFTPPDKAMTYCYSYLVFCSVALIMSTIAFIYAWKGEKNVC